MDMNLIELELQYEFDCNYRDYLACEKARFAFQEDKYKSWLAKNFPGLDLSDSIFTQSDRNYYWQWFLNECC